MRLPWAQSQSESQPQLPAEGTHSTTTTSTALVPVEVVPGDRADVRPPYPPPQFARQSDPADIERLIAVRERVTRLETQFDGLAKTSKEHGDSIGEVEGFHKGVKIGAWILGGLGGVLIAVVAIIWAIFSDDIRVIRKMSAEYSYCQDHRGDKDGADCIVSPQKSASVVGKTTKGGTP